MVNSVFPESPLDSTTVLLAQQAAMAKSSDWGKKPFLAFLPRHWKQWHPTLIHFPIALLVLEAGFLLAFRIRPSQQIATFSQWLLYLTCISLPLVIYSGISDVGANLGPGWAFWNGLKDRITNFLRMESTVSLHVLLALCLTFLLVTRVIWRIRSGQQVLWGKQGYAFLAASLLGLWLLFAIGQVGGSISHP